MNLGKMNIDDLLAIFFCKKVGIICHSLEDTVVIYDIVVSRAPEFVKEFNFGGLYDAEKIWDKEEDGGVGFDYYRSHPGSDGQLCADSEKWYTGENAESYDHIFFEDIIFADAAPVPSFDGLF